MVYLVYILKKSRLYYFYALITLSNKVKVTIFPSYIFYSTVFGAVTRIKAENLGKLQVSRAGYRAHLTQTIKKATNIATKEDSLTDSDFTSLKGIINDVNELARKRSILEELDEKIVGMIEDPKELEKEIFQTEDIKEQIDATVAQISNTKEHFLSNKSSPSYSPSEVTQVVLENTSSQSRSTTVNTNDHHFIF
jgi:hypothetical protein